MTEVEQSRAALRLVQVENGFAVHCGQLRLLLHTRDAPAFAIGRGTPKISNDRGHFGFTDTAEWCEPFGEFTFEANRVVLRGEVELMLEIGDGQIALSCSDPTINRFRVALLAEPDEAVWGCGEQLSYLNLRGRTFPLWTGEPGIGRDPAALGLDPEQTPPFIGNYWTTYYPQPTFLSSRGYALHGDSRAYAKACFLEETLHTLTFWEVPSRLEFFFDETPAELVGHLSTRFGRQPELPEWAYSGAIVGLKDGERSLERLERIVEAGAAVTGLWCEDWCGIRETGFGRRLFWDWRADPARYPDLARRIADLRARGIAFLGYTNPYLAVDGTFYAEAEAAGHFVRHSNGETYLVDFGEFTCGLIDLTSRAACDWFADRILGTEMLGLGMAGWMADFGEYLPVDAVLADGSDPMLAHNCWPVLWAELNARALQRHDNNTQPIFFMRSGHSGIGEHCPLLWAGDQSVDFSRHDGIGTAICAALSAGLMGNAYHHSDLGGYASFGDKVRTPELLMRWAELAALTPVMRSHEGNRPDANLQIDATPEILAHYAAMTRLHARLGPYVRMLASEARATGLPLQRALFLHYPDDPQCRDIQDQYLYGRDLLVAPVIEEGATSRRLYLPVDAPGNEQWVHLWSERAYEGGWTEVDAPLGQPPIFYREGCEHAELFASLRNPTRTET